MKAKLLPLEYDYKYEGTKIQIDFEDGYGKEIIRLWTTGEIIPSIRELPTGMTEEEYLKQLEIWQDDPEYSPSSYQEDKIVYNRAIELINAINNYKK